MEKDSIIDYYLSSPIYIHSYEGDAPAFTDTLVPPHQEKMRTIYRQRLRTNQQQRTQEKTKKTQSIIINEDTGEDADKDLDYNLDHMY